MTDSIDIASKYENKTVCICCKEKKDDNSEFLFLTNAFVVTNSSRFGVNIGLCNQCYARMLSETNDMFDEERDEDGR